jgi:hypothetical protein
MNGVLNDVESRNLTPDELFHYFGIGLCSAPTAQQMERFDLSYREHLADIQYQFEDANDAAASLQRDLETALFELAQLRHDHNNWLNDQLRMLRFAP